MSIFRIRESEISLYSILEDEYVRKYKKFSYNFNIHFNIRNLILEKYKDIKNLTYTDFIKETKIEEENINKNNLIEYLNSNYINTNNDSFNNEKNITILKDEEKNNLNINYYLLLKDNNIFITDNINCYLYDKSMKLMQQIKLKEIPETNANYKENIISYIHYKKYSVEKNKEIVYAFITSTIYELIIINNLNNYTIEKREHNLKRISYKIDGVIDMINGDLITCCHMYPVICWRKNEMGIFFEFKVLTEEQPYIKSAINIIHLPNNEFTFTSNAWPSIKFFKFDINNKKDNYNLIKDIRLNCSSRKNTLILYKNEIIIVGLQFDELCLINTKNKEIISKVKGIDIEYLFVRNNGDIIIREIFDYTETGPKISIYRIKEGEIVFRGVLQNQLQIYIKDICENNNGEMFIYGYENDFNKEKNKINKIYLFKKYN